MISALASLVATSVLIQGGMIVDGTGRPGYTGDVRIQGTKVVAVGHLRPQPGERVVDAKGLTVAPGFLDAHSHADGNLKELTSQLKQGITTAICGQDGSRDASVQEQKKKTKGAALRFEFFSGHGGLRSAVMKKTNRAATAAEIGRMKALLEADMKAGALGLSSGLEYDDGHESTTEELIALAKVAARHHGIYISHVRDESAGIFHSIRELIRIGKEAKIPAQVSHIKMGVASVWHQAPKVIGMLREASGKKAGLPQFTADVYPYTYWQSTIRVLTASRNYHDRKVWEAALADVNGPGNVLLTNYSPDPSWQGKTLAEVSKITGKSAPDLIMHIIDATADGKGRESVLVTAMNETDVITFVKQPWIMFCSDGSGGGSHPRSAGSFPRILARYVREMKVLKLEEAIRKMTSLPADRFGLKDRGRIKPGLSADLVVFDAKEIKDTSTPANPTSHATGMKHVFVRGVHHEF